MWGEGVQGAEGEYWYLFNVNRKNRNNYLLNQILRLLHLCLYNSNLPFAMAVVAVSSSLLHSSLAGSQKSGGIIDFLFAVPPKTMRLYGMY